MTTYKTKADFTWKHGVAMEDEIPAGTSVELQGGVFFVRPSYFPAFSISRHDATYYGCRVNPENVEALEAVHADWEVSPEAACAAIAKAKRV